jgi:hypothetical protein
LPGTEVWGRCGPAPASGESSRCMGCNAFDSSITLSPARSPRFSSPVAMTLTMRLPTGTATAYATSIRQVDDASSPCGNAARKEPFGCGQGSLGGIRGSQSALCILANITFLRAVDSVRTFRQNENRGASPAISTEFIKVPVDTRLVCFDESIVGLYLVCCIAVLLCVKKDFLVLFPAGRVHIQYVHI